MDSSKKGLLSKMWEHLKHFPKQKDQKPKLTKSKTFGGSSPVTMETQDNQMINSNSPKKKKMSSATIPEGYLSIYVGPQKERFVIKTEYINHPLVKELLEEATSEYGYCNQGPLVLPCEVDHFENVMVKVDSSITRKGGFVMRCHSSNHLL